MFKNDNLKKLYLEKSDTVYNSYYKQYKASFVKQTDLPIFTSSNFNEKDRRFLSKTNCSKLKQPVKADEIPVAWYRGMNGFYPLFFREWENTAENRKLLGYKDLNYSIVK
ncbi:hypothetical protein KLF50_14980 (plasmid) [Clostridium perfringens]|uniref:hypothetical protein n=1 Tax=Clostridium perfringens TaxID=1502 RepID=UPI001CC8F8B9|nr:hypothetical protein [Clostridium perfringens]UBK83468.1 hypothetical protein KLF50_14980 [Clostridium perfringens]